MERSRGNGRPSRDVPQVRPDERDLSNFIGGSRDIAGVLRVESDAPGVRPYIAATVLWSCFDAPGVRPYISTFREDWAKKSGGACASAGVFLYEKFYLLCEVAVSGF